VSVDLLPGDALILLSDGFFEYGNAGGEQFGEERVRAIVEAHHGRTATALLDCVLQGLDAFAGGASQEDDMTAVLVRRAALA
jgi:phosphoserine phosphatase